MRLRSLCRRLDRSRARLIDAVRCVAAMALCIAALTAVHTSFGVRFAGAFTVLAVVFALRSVAREHENPHESALLLSGTCISGLFLTAGILLAPLPSAGEGAFLLVIFLAVAARRFGARGHAAGYVAYMAFLAALLAHVGADQLPQAWIATALAYAAVYVTRHLPPARFMRAVLGSPRPDFDRRLADVVLTAIAIVRDRETDGHAAVSAADALERLRRTLLAGADLLERYPADGGRAQMLWMMRAEGAAQRLVVLILRTMRTQPPVDPADLHTLITNMRILHRYLTAPTTEGRRAGYGYRHAPPDPYSAGLRQGPHRQAQSPVSIQHCHRALRELFEAAFEDASVPAGEDERSVVPPGRSTERPSYSALTDGELSRFSTRQAIQAVTASAGALALGLVISPTLWYWAVNTVWVVFAGTSGTGAVAFQAAGRMAGTVAGVLLGFALAMPAGMNTQTVLVALVLCQVGMFSARAYWAYTFYLTASLFLVTLLQHTFTVSVLVVRVEETAVGVAAAALTATALLPNPDEAASDQRLAELLDVMNRVADHAVAMQPKLARNAATGNVLALERAWEAFRTSCNPSAHLPSPRSARRIRTRRMLVTAEIATYHARNIALLAEQMDGAAAPRCKRSGRDLVRRVHCPGAVRRIHDTKAEMSRGAAVSALALEPGFASGQVPAADRIAHHAERLAAVIDVLHQHLNRTGRNPDGIAGKRMR